jgi:hypothetical protein
LTIVNNGKVQGARITLGVYDSSVFAWRQLDGRQPVKVVAAERRFDLLISRKRESPVASSMVIALKADAPGAQPNEGLLLMSRGVVYRRPKAELGFPLAQAVVSADHLEKNLSQSDLVEGEEYEALLEALRAEVDDLVLEVCLNPPPGWSADTASAFTRALHDRYPSDGPQAPLGVETFRRMQRMRALCGTAEGQESQMEFWRSLVTQDPKAGGKFAKELAVPLRGALARALTQESWQDALRCRVSLGELEGREPDALQVVLMVQAGWESEARALHTPELAGYSPALAYLLGWIDTVEGEPLAGLLRFQRALEQGDLVQAEVEAKTLEQVEDNRLISLWLGWWAFSRRSYNQACHHWDRAVAGLAAHDWVVWTATLWSELSGKVGFKEQVRWHVKRGFEDLQFTLLKAERSEFGRQGHGRKQLQLALLTWQALMGGRHAEARQIFRTGLLTTVINVNDLRLEPLRRFLDPGFRLDG